MGLHCFLGHVFIVVLLYYYQKAMSRTDIIVLTCDNEFAIQVQLKIALNNIVTSIM